MMLFDPIKRKLFTSDGVLLKKLECPFDFTWDELESTHIKYRNCKTCKTQVLDTSQFEEHEIIAFLQKDPATCIKVNLDQPNILITTDDLDKDRKY